MADAEIRLTADASGAKSELSDLRSKIDAMIDRLGLTGKAGQAAGDLLEESFREMNLSAGQADKALIGIEENFKRNTGSVGAFGFSLKDLSKSFLGTISVVAILKANLDDLKPSIEANGKLFREWAIEMGASEDAANLFTNSVEMMVNPFTIIENLTENIRIATRLYADEVVGATNAEINYNIVANEKVERLKAVLKAQQDLVRQERDTAEATSVRADALEREIRTQQQSGEVSKFLRDQLKLLLDQYDRMGTEAPQSVRELAAELDILSTAQERAAKEAEREAAAFEKQADAARKVKDESAPLVESKREQSELSKLLEEGLRRENEALEENARLTREAAEAAKEKFDADQKRAAELQSKPVLEIEEVNELADLNAGMTERQFEYSEAAQEAELAEAALSESRAELSDETKTFSDAMENLTELTQEQKEALGDIGNVDLGGAYRDWQHEVDNFYDSQGNVINQAERFGDVWVATNEKGEEVITNFDAELGVLEDGLEDTEQAADGAASAFDAMGDSAGRVGDEAARGLEKAGESINSQLDALDKYLEKQEEIKRLWAEIKRAAEEAAEAI